MTYIIEATKRGLIGILSALVLSYTLLLVTSMPHDMISIQSNLLAKHYLLYAVSGFYFAFISIIFSIDEWSILKQFTSHIAASIPFLPIAYWTGMMPQNIVGILSFTSIFIACYLISFILYKLHLKKQAKLINDAL